ncbi:MAG: type II toxin-antitoxin system RatA family toxin [Pseudohongiellaceae bacterium]
MATIQRSVLVEYSDEQMFDLINDIEAYPKFMQGCKEAKVISRKDGEVVGELCLSGSGITLRVTTRNQLQRPDKIIMQLVEGDFSKFNAHWEFLPLNEAACKVTLNMEFKLTSKILNLAAGNMLTSSANALVDSLVKRAKEVYG